MKNLESFLDRLSKKPTRRQKKVLKTFFKIGEKEQGGFIHQRVTQIEPITLPSLGIHLGWETLTAQLLIYEDGSSDLFLGKDKVKRKFTSRKFGLKEEIRLIYTTLKTFFRSGPTCRCTECGAYCRNLLDRPLVAGDYRGDQIYFYKCPTCNFQWDLTEKDQIIIRERMRKYENASSKLHDYSDVVYAEMEKELLEIIKRYRKKLSPHIKEVNKLAADLTDNYPMRWLHAFYDFEGEDEREPEIDNISGFFDWD